jgi:hypothetical protein
MVRTGDSLPIGTETRHSGDSDQVVQMSHRAVHRRLCIQRVLAGLVLAVILSTGTASAQAPQADQRWYPWIGCWSSSQNGLTGAASRVCVVPAAGASAVDLVTVANGRIVSREHIEANAQQLPSQRDGCSGWESARWSADGRRLYVKSEHQCASGGKRESEGLITISPQGDWLDVVSVTLGSNTGVRVLRHRPTIEPADLPAEVATALKATLSARLREARTAAVAAIGYPAIVEASRQVSASVVAAWLNDVREDLPVDGKRLVELADAGVPDRVIDMLVALAYPAAFSVPPSPTNFGALASGEPPAGGGVGGGGFAGLDTYTSSSCADDFSVFGFGGCAPYGYAPYGYYPYGYGAYGYLPYYGFGALGAFGGYGGWYATPPVVIGRPGDELSHGQAINGRGYTSGNSGTPRTTNSGSSSSSSSGSSGSSSSSGSGTTSSAPSSGGGSSSGGGDRTAHPR